MTSTYDVEIENEVTDDQSTVTTWHWWRKMRSLLEENSKVGISLVMTPDLPGADEMERWFAEPIRSLTIPTSLFLSNKSGFPVLSKAHQMFVNKFFQVV